MVENIIKVLTTAAMGRFYDENGKKIKVGSSVMVQMPTGTGKTYVMAAVARSKGQHHPSYGIRKRAFEGRTQGFREEGTWFIKRYRVVTETD